MEFWEVIKKRRSIRNFNSSKKVSNEQIEKILEAGRLAPSAHNYQDWYFVVVENQKVKEQLVEVAGDQTFLAEAAVVIVVCGDMRLADKHSLRHGQNFYTIQDTAIATICMWLTAVDQGLSACWVGAFDEEKVRQVLGIEDYFRPVALLPIGYPAETPSPRPRRNLKDLVYKVA